MFDTRDAYLEAVSQARAAADAYYNLNGTSTFTDEEYDLLLAEISETGQANDWHDGDDLFTVSGGQAAGDTEVTHASPMLSLSKFKQLTDVTAFAERLNLKVVLEPKADGIAIALEYVNHELVRASTRGNGAVGEDITAKLLTVQLEKLPRRLDPRGPANLEVRGELYLTTNNFEALNAWRVREEKEPFANRRNVIAGVLRTHEDVSHTRLSFAAYDVLGERILDEETLSDSYSVRMTALVEHGFLPAMAVDPRLAVFASAESLAKRVRDFGDYRRGEQMPTDGIVIKADSYADRERLGEASHHPRWAVAYKYEAESTTSVLREVLRDIGKTGRVTYKARYDKVLLDGSLVEYATLNNPDHIRKLGLRIGDTIHVRKANDIIPEIFAISPVNRGPVAYAAPNTCPICGRELDWGNVNGTCHNPGCRLIPKIVYAFGRKTLDADTWNRGNITALVLRYNITGFEQLYNLSRQQISDATLFVNKQGNPVKIGDDRAETLLTALAETKKRPLDKVLASLSIPNMGTTTSRELVGIYHTLDALLGASVTELASIENLAQISAESIHTGLRANAATLTALKALGFDALNGGTPQRATDGALNGINFVITGTIEGYKRDDLARKIEALGGVVSSSISSKTNILIYGENAGSKLAKAAKLGVNTLAADGFIKQYIVTDS